jgi:hypothetical protein
MAKAKTVAELEVAADQTVDPIVAAVAAALKDGSLSTYTSLDDIAAILNQTPADVTPPVDTPPAE